MRLRNLLLATGAVVAAGALALAPAAQASSPTGGPVAAIEVGGAGTNISHAIALTMESAAFTINVYGVPVNITCTAGSAGGAVNGGATGVSPNDGFVLTSMSLTCPSIFPGTTVAMSLACNVGIVFADSNVHNGTNTATDVIDSGASAKISNVDGSLKATDGTGTHCVQMSISDGCTFRIGGAMPAQFDEAATTVAGQDHQHLNLSGTGLQIKSPVGCLGRISNNQAVSVNVVFGVYAADGLIDFTKPTAPTGGDIASIEVGGDGSNTTHATTLGRWSVSATLNVYGVPVNLTCSTASAGGVVHGGTTGVSPNDAITLTSMSLTCPSIFPGTSASFSLACDLGLEFLDDNVHDGTIPGTDTIDGLPGTATVGVVDGSLKATNSAGTHCVQVSISNGCTFRVGGSANAEFDETAQAANRQRLVLSGSGLRVKSPSGCLGAVAADQAISLDATFNVDTADGLIDFQQTP